MTLALDFESRSRAALKTVGGRNYWAHESTEVLVCAWLRVETGEIGLWHRGDPPPIDPGERWAAHNATGFDRFGVERLAWRPYGDRNYIDTSELARMAGYPGKLEALGELKGTPKDVASSRFTTGLSTPKRPKWITADDWRGLSPGDKRQFGDQVDIDSAKQARVDRYCLTDVEVMSNWWEDLIDFEGIEPEVRDLDRLINDRGFYFDRDLAQALLECDRRNSESTLAHVASSLGMTPADVRAAAMSPAQFVASTGAANAQAETVDEILANTRRWPAKAVGLATARRALASIARGKLTAGLARVSPDSRVRDSLRYYAAHTGRWGGKGFQPQNLPSPSKALGDYLEDLDEQSRHAADDYLCYLADAAIAGEPLTADEIDLLVRATISAAPGKRLVVRDFSGVEARALALLAGDAGSLDVFRTGQDPYKVEASKVFGVPYDKIDKTQRKVGKASTLGCGYGMGAGRMHDFASTVAGVDLDAAGVGAQALVAAWRKAHAPIVRFWYAVSDAFVEACAGHESTIAGCDFVCGSDDAIAIFLPSGRPIVYHQPRVTYDERQRPQISFCGTKGREHTFGGKLVENIIQAWCRDKLVHSVALAEAAGLPVVLTVHDEIVCEVDESACADAAAELQRCTTTSPDWAQGFPEGASGFEGRWYRK